MKLAPAFVICKSFKAFCFVRDRKSVEKCPPLRKACPQAYAPCQTKRARSRDSPSIETEIEGVSARRRRRGAAPARPRRVATHPAPRSIVPLATGRDPAVRSPSDPYLGLGRFSERESQGRCHFRPSGREHLAACPLRHRQLSQRAFCTLG